MKLPLVSELHGQTDLRHRMRDLRFFETTFRRNATLTLSRTGLRAKTDQGRLRSCFLAWLEAFYATHPFAAIDRFDFICFSAGGMLAQLLRYDPLTVIGVGTSTDEPRDLWPAGSAYVSYCLGITLTVIEQEGQRLPPLSDHTDDPRLWHSFKENARDNPDFAIPFIDLLMGQTPNWTEPTLPDQRPAMKDGYNRIPRPER